MYQVASHIRTHYKVVFAFLQKLHYNEFLSLENACLKLVLDELNKDLDATNENLEKAEKTAGENSQAIDTLDNQLRELLDRNKQLEENLARYKSDTDRVGSANSDRNDQNYMKSESISTFSIM